MKLTPLDIKRAEFTRVWRGYSPEEVDSFLAMVSDEVEQLVAEHREQDRRVGDLEREIGDFRAKERTLMDTLVTAQRASEEMREASRREADMVKRDGQLRSEQMMDAARIEAERLLLETRCRAHETLEDARDKARAALDLARGDAEETYRKVRSEVASLQRHLQALMELRSSFEASFRAYLQGQLQALEAWAAPMSLPEPMPPEDMLIVTPEEAEALAALDRELARFAAETAPSEATPAEEASPPSAARKDQARKASQHDGSEVLIDGGSKPS